MNSRTDAIEYLKTLGLDAHERDWALGETIWIGACPYEESPGVRFYSKSAYLYQRDGKWSIFPEWKGHSSVHQSRFSLQEACDQVAILLKSASK
jgi:hypothetical protein